MVFVFLGADSGCKQDEKSSLLSRYTVKYIFWYTIGHLSISHLHFMDLFILIHNCCLSWYYSFSGVINIYVFNLVCCLKQLYFLFMESMNIYNLFVLVFTFHALLRYILFTGHLPVFRLQLVKPFLRSENHLSPNLVILNFSDELMD